ncbi:hypothetical protein CPB84DRAFT_1841712 [Gymnopilus junonius]|uniref:Uncharacterized protein n=1 Tax=Gymnopilus junonius TaxID=109634 RepID=A0A9P5TU22_GYMJU|nr:hypothetical protein CPB84DRAFT_1841712 [Gymnopilus junonius]
MDPLGITCRCGRFVPYKPCASNANGNKGRLVAVCNGPNAQGVPCKTICWKKGSSASPTSSPPAALPSVFATEAPPGKPVCPVNGCGQSRTAPDCAHQLCRKHCISSGGCSSKNHIPPTSSSACTALPPPIPIPDANTQPPAPAPSPSSTIDLGHAPVAVVVSLPSRLDSTTPSCIDAQPNPRYVSHMPAIFTDQIPSLSLWSSQNLLQLLERGVWQL